MRIYLGPFEWRERISSKTGKPAPAGVLGWRMPVGATQALDFRGPLGVETPGAFSPVKALFVAPDSVLLPAPFVQVASDPLEVLSASARRALADVFESAVASTRFIDVIHELTTGHADLSRSVKCPPRIASRDGRIKHLIAGQVVKAVEVGPGTLEWLGVQARHHAVYRALRESGIKDLHRKYLSTLATKYRLSEAKVVDNFTPPELPKESPVRPSTTLTESFPGTSATLGGDQTWTEVAQAWENASGVGQYSTNNATGSARCEGTLSTDDMRVTITVTREDNFNSSYGGAVARFAAAANTGYQHNSNRAINDYYCTRREAGSGTDIITSELSGSISLPATDKIEVDGDQVEIWEGVNSRGSTTDTDISGNVLGGLNWYQFFSTQTVQFDNWEATDLAGGPTTFEGTGDLDVQAPTLSGAGLHHRVGTGALSLQAATLSGAGVLRKTASGVLTAQAATMSGAGIARRASAGTLTAQAPAVSGDGVVRRTATGGLSAGAAVIAGNAIVWRVATGGLTPSDATIEGVGVNSATPVSEPETGSHPMSNLARLRLIRI